MATRYGNSLRNGRDAGDEYDPHGEGQYSNRSQRSGSATPNRPSPSRNGSMNATTTTTGDINRQANHSPAPNDSVATSVPRDESDAQRQISNVLDHIRQEWPSMLQDDCVPVVLGLQLLDSSSVGRAHDYRKFRQAHDYLQRSLKNIVHEHHQGFNSSIGTFHKIQGSIQASQKKVRHLKDSLAGARSSLCSADPELAKLSSASRAYDELVQALAEIEELRLVPDQLEARISEKRFLTAVDLLQTALKRMRRSELDEIGALADLRVYLANQETALQDVLVEELHEHLYLKSPYCQERWHNLASRHNNNDAAADAAPSFHIILDSLDIGKPAVEDPAKNPEGETFSYVLLLVEALNRLGRLQNAVDTLKQRLPVELFAVVSETTAEVDNRHLKTVRNRPGRTPDPKIQADVIGDLLKTLYAKFEAIAEGHRVFHEAVKALIRREGAGDNALLLGSFKELWHLYQNEIRTLLHNYVTTDADVYHSDRSSNPVNRSRADAARGAHGEHLFKLSDMDAKGTEMAAEMDALEAIIRSAVPGLTGAGSRKDRKGDNRTKNAVALESDTASPQNKSLVEPSVFNMSLLLPSTLSFLQRLKTIVPPGSDLATSTLTTFLDNFLVNVFQPQLDETLGKLSDAVFGEPDSFLQEHDWRNVARRPILRGATAFFDIVTAFCRMLGTIPHDQALSSLIVTQMNRYYERCLTWYSSLVGGDGGQVLADSPRLRASARMAITAGEVHDILMTLREATDEKQDCHGLLAQEAQLLVSQSNSSVLKPTDVIQDRDVISSLCLLYTSLNWLRVKVSGLRHITHQEADSSRPMTPKVPSRRWTLSSGSTKAERGEVILPLTHETVQ